MKLARFGCYAIIATSLHTACTSPSCYEVRTCGGNEDADAGEGVIQASPSLGGHFGTSFGVGGTSGGSSAGSASPATGGSATADAGDSGHGGDLPAGGGAAPGDGGKGGDPSQGGMSDAGAFPTVTSGGAGAGGEGPAAEGGAGAGGEGPVAEGGAAGRARCPSRPLSRPPVQTGRSSAVHRAVARRHWLSAGNFSAVAKRNRARHAVPDARRPLRATRAINQSTWPS
jgi:hypothetical protein